MWNEINNQDDLNAFLKRLGYFHDSCIKEIQYISGAYVKENLSMMPINRIRTARVIFQRQFRDPSAIEMEFGGLYQLSLFPQDEMNTCEITDATMMWHGGRIYWCDCGGLSVADLADYQGALICAASVRWRTADEYMGPDEIYKAL